MEWDRSVQDVQLVINNSVNISTGETPHLLQYGYDKRLPVKLCDDALPPRKIYNYDSYIEQRLQQYYRNVRKARNELKKSQNNWEKYYKDKVRINFQ